MEPRSSPKDHCFRLSLERRSPAAPDLAPRQRPWRAAHRMARDEVWLVFVSPHLKSLALSSTAFSAAMFGCTGTFRRPCKNKG